MSSSPNKGLNLQTTGTNSGTWGVVANQNFSIIDEALGGTLSLDVSGSSDINLTMAQSLFLNHYLTGTLTGNINYVFPDAGGIYTINNQTTGAFTLTAQITGGSGGVIVPQGGVATVSVDATNNVAVGGAPIPAAGASGNVLISNGQKFNSAALTLANISSTGASGYVPVSNGSILVPTALGVSNLADYSNGTWTAAFSPAAGSITINPSNNTGRYVKIGNVVTVTGLFIVQSVSGASGALSLTGLPFASGPAQGNYSAVSIAATTLMSVNDIIGWIGTGSNQISLQNFSSGVESDLSGYVQANSQFIISATYFTN